MEIREPKKYKKIFRKLFRNNKAAELQIDLNCARYKLFEALDEASVQYDPHNKSSYDIFKLIDMLADKACSKAYRRKDGTYGVVSRDYVSFVKTENEALKKENKTTKDIIKQKDKVIEGLIEQKMKYIEFIEHVKTKHGI